MCEHSIREELDSDNLAFTALTYSLIKKHDVSDSQFSCEIRGL